MRHGKGGEREERRERKERGGEEGEKRGLENPLGGTGGLEKSVRRARMRAQARPARSHSMSPHTLTPHIHNLPQVKNDPLLKWIS